MEVNQEYEPQELSKSSQILLILINPKIDKMLVIQSENGNPANSVFTNLLKAQYEFQNVNQAPMLFVNGRFPIEECYVSPLINHDSTATPVDSNSTVQKDLYSTVKHIFQNHTHEGQRILINNNACSENESFCHFTIHQWIIDQSKDNLFDCIIWLKLSNLTHGKYPKRDRSYELVDIIKKEYFDEHHKIITDDEIISSIQTHKILWLIDASNCPSTNIPIYLQDTVNSLINYARYQILIIDSLSTADKYNYSHKISLIGYDYEKIKLYIDKFFTCDMTHILSTELKFSNQAQRDKMQLANSLFQLIQTMPNVWHLAQIPLYLELICTIYLDNYIHHAQDINTMNDMTAKLLRFGNLTEFFERLFAFLLKCLSKENRHRLEHLAFGCTKSNTSEFYTETSDHTALVDELLRKGVIYLTQPNDANPEKLYRFALPLFQNFLAAKHIKYCFKHYSFINPLLAEVYQFTSISKYRRDIANIFSFSSGLLTKDIKNKNSFYSFLHCLQSQPYDYAGLYYQNLMLACINEIKLEGIVNLQHEAIIQLQTHLRMIWQTILTKYTNIGHSKKSMPFTGTNILSVLIASIECLAAIATAIKKIINFIKPVYSHLHFLFVNQNIITLMLPLLAESINAQDDQIQEFTLYSMFVLDMIADIPKTNGLIDEVLSKYRQPAKKVLYKILLLVSSFVNNPTGELAKINEYMEPVLKSFPDLQLLLSTLWHKALNKKTVLNRYVEMLKMENKNRHDELKIKLNFTKSELEHQGNNIIDKIIVLTQIYHAYKFTSNFFSWQVLNNFMTFGTSVIFAFAFQSCFTIFREMQASDILELLTMETLQPDINQQILMHTIVGGFITIRENAITRLCESLEIEKSLQPTDSSIRKHVTQKIIEMLNLAEEPHTLQDYFSESRYTQMENTLNLIIKLEDCISSPELIKLLLKLMFDHKNCRIRAKSAEALSVLSIDKLDTRIIKCLITEKSCAIHEHFRLNVIVNILILFLSFFLTVYLPTAAVHSNFLKHFLMLSLQLFSCYIFTKCTTSVVILFFNMLSFATTLSIRSYQMELLPKFGHIVEFTTEVVRFMTYKLIEERDEYAKQIILETFSRAAPKNIKVELETIVEPLCKTIINLDDSSYLKIIAIQALENLMIKEAIPKERSEKLILFLNIALKFSFIASIKIQLIKSLTKILIFNRDSKEIQNLFVYLANIFTDSRVDASIKKEIINFWLKVHAFLNESTLRKVFNLLNDTIVLSKQTVKSELPFYANKALGELNASGKMPKKLLYSASVEKYIEILHSPQQNRIHSEAIQALGRIPAADVTPEVLGAITFYLSDLSRCSDAINALAELGSTAANPIILKNLLNITKSDKFERKKAVEAIGKIMRVKVYPFVVRELYLIKDSNSAARKYLELLSIKIVSFCFDEPDSDYSALLAAGYLNKNATVLIYDQKLIIFEDDDCIQLNLPEKHKARVLDLLVALNKQAVARGLAPAIHRSALIDHVNHIKWAGSSATTSKSSIIQSNETLQNAAIQRAIESLQSIYDRHNQTTVKAVAHPKSTSSSALTSNQDESKLRVPQNMGEDEEKLKLHSPQSMEETDQMILETLNKLLAEVSEQMRFHISNPIEPLSVQPIWPKTSYKRYMHKPSAPITIAIHPNSAATNESISLIKDSSLNKLIAPENQSPRGAFFKNPNLHSMEMLIQEGVKSSDTPPVYIDAVIKNATVMNINRSQADRILQNGK
jgi:hypothetical protein